MIRMASWNVNGIRAAIRNGFWDWFDKSQADIVCLQETKITHRDFQKLKEDHELTPLVVPPEDQTELFKTPETKNSKGKCTQPIYYALACAEKAGYSGVLLLSKIKPNKIEIGLGDEKFDREGRVIVAHYNNFILFNCYFPNAGRDLERLSYKMAFNDFLLKRLESYRKKQKHLVITGDFNVAHTEIDIKNPKSNEGNSGFTKVERDWFTKLLEHKYADTFRALNPNARDVYSWWSYRPGVRERNVGWRIDTFVVTHEMMSHVKNARVEMEQMGSDHCPVWMEVDSPTIC